PPEPPPSSHRLTQPQSSQRCEPLSVHASGTISAPPLQRQIDSVGLLQTENVFRRFSSNVSILMLLVTTTDITVWILSVLLALGTGSAKYAKWKARNQLVRELAVMEP